MMRANFTCICGIFLVPCDVFVILTSIIPDQGCISEIVEPLLPIDYNNGLTCHEYRRTLLVLLHAELLLAGIAGWPVVQCDAGSRDSVFRVVYASEVSFQQPYIVYHHIDETFVTVGDMLCIYPRLDCL